MLSDTDGIQLLGWSNAADTPAVQFPLPGMDLDASINMDLAAFLDLASPEQSALDTQIPVQGSELLNDLQLSPSNAPPSSSARPIPESSIPASLPCVDAPSTPAPTPPSSDTEASVLLRHTEKQAVAPTPTLCLTQAKTPQVQSASSTRKRKRARTSSDADERDNNNDDDDDDDDTGLSFIMKSTSRTKAHSKRMNVILKKAIALNIVTRPYLLVYCSRPESVGHHNGKGMSFISSNLERILGERFLEDLHKKVADSTKNVVSDPQVALQTNLEVERLRREREEEKSRRLELEAQVNTMQQRLAHLELAQG
ncbi:hypothetical protein BV20DRAFT_1096774 [Pilatotrama ljubarskyi]|nr:hypothetical protein BV20DRAFT_1096774 [Pilatotrama ljubarskyi]